MSGLDEFLSMGGYGAFVWPSFGLTAAVLIGLWLQSASALKHAEDALAETEADAGTRR